MNEKPASDENDTEASRKRNTEIPESEEEAFLKKQETARYGVSLGEWRAKHWAAAQKRDRQGVDDCKRVTAAFLRLEKALQKLLKARPDTNAARSLQKALNDGNLSTKTDLAREDGRNFISGIKKYMTNLFNPKNPEKELERAWKEACKAVSETAAGRDILRKAGENGGICIESVLKAAAATEKHYRSENARDRYEMSEAAELAKESRKLLDSGRKNPSARSQ